MFNLTSTFTPSWDQPQAIKEILESFRKWENQVTLLWATGTGKTFTMANVIQDVQKPTLILSHNKTLAAQLATEFKYFFPDNAVHYFVSYFDYYQPESYLPEKGTYIEKEATINEEIQMYRLSTMASLLSREDVIVVASVSALYGLGSKEFFNHNSLNLKVWEEYDFDEIKKKLLAMQYKPVQSKIEQGMFEISGDKIDIYVSTEQFLYRLYFNFNELEMIEKKNALTFEHQWEAKAITVRPATQYLQDMTQVDDVVKAVKIDLAERVAYYEKRWELVEAQRLKKRVGYDIRMIRETWFVNGIENYSPYFENRLDGAPPNTLFDYFPDDMLCLIDESHMTVPQFRGMPKADASRKSTLIEHGFRLPSAINHRPLGNEEFQTSLSWRWYNAEVDHPDLQQHIKPDAKTLFVSATPASFEIELSKRVVQQVIRPTGLLDPITYVYPKWGEYSSLIASIDRLEPAEKNLLTTEYDREHVDTFN